MRRSRQLLRSLAAHSRALDAPPPPCLAAWQRRHHALLCPPDAHRERRAPTSSLLQRRWQSTQLPAAAAPDAGRVEEALQQVADAGLVLSESSGVADIAGESMVAIRALQQVLEYGHVAAGLPWCAPALLVRAGRRR